MPRGRPGESILREDQITTVTVPPTALAALVEEEVMDLETVICWQGRRAD